ncbi:hypothetical protein B6V62_11750 [Escherichia coli]|nr:hypothetical protein [Escherichia coli]
MWALIEDNLVQEITDVDPSGRFHHDLTWVRCDEKVLTGYQYDGSEFYPVQSPVTVTIEKN